MSYSLSANDSIVSSRDEASINITVLAAKLLSVLTPGGEPYIVRETLITNEVVDTVVEASISLVGTVGITLDTVLKLEDYSKVETIFIEDYFIQISKKKG